MPDSNKDRINVAVYYRDSISGRSDSQSLGYAKFHWAIWVEPKGGDGSGTCYHVSDQDTYVNVPGSGGWQFEARKADFYKSRNYVARFRVGEAAQNCISWTMAALKELQAIGVVDKLDITKFMDFALKKTDDRAQQQRHTYGDRLFEDYTARTWLGHRL
ncbi:hypothetical protein F5Y17DRAFT_475471 [Xylariaceae sp. FL0594]|nr:hypothetical protein F5Y17DRAFT_475471 [Xylariaceae sp. FL0594]